MATKKRSVPLPDSGIDWSSPVGEFQPSNPAANDAATAEQPSSALRRAADYIPTLVKSAIAVPEFAVGMADLATGGRVGKFLENEGGAIGFRPKEARAALDEFYSPEQKSAFQEVQNADGFIGTGMAALRNPSVIAQSAVESLGLMGAGGVVARGVGVLAPRLSGTALGAIGEGVTGAGSAAEQIRQETPDGLLTGKQAALAATSGLADTVFGALGGKIAHRMGIADVDTMLAGKGSPTTTKSFVKSVLEGAVSEGLLEELPQSIAEQVAQNAALDKPLSEGVDQQAVLGLLTGGIMGAGANAAHSLFPSAHPADEIRATKLPESGPLTKGLNAAIETHADAVESATAEAATQTRRQQTAQIVEQLRLLPPAQQEEALGLMAVADNMRAPGPVRRRAQNRLDYLFSSVAPQGATPAAQTTETVPQDAVAPVAPTVEVPNEPAAQPAEQPDAIAQREADRPAPAVTPRQDGDILTNSGVPFRNMTAAMRALGRAGEGYELAPVEGGLVVRKSAAPQPEQMQHAPAEESVPPVVDAAQAPVQDVPAPSSEATQTPDPVATSPTQAADVAGEPIDKEWTAFTPESGTKGIPRADMPQVQASHRGPLVNFLNARGITHETVEIPAGELKPTQAEFSPAKVQQAKDFTDTDRSILVSSDGHVLDGHHQWLAKLDSNEPVKAIRLNAPIADLVSTVREFPSAGQADGATTAQPTGTLQEQWQDAVKRGDTEAASKINDQIVAEKQSRKATEAAPADDTNQTSGTRAEAQAAADQAPAPARSDAAAPASVPTAGGAAATEAGGVTDAEGWDEKVRAVAAKRASLPERIPMTGLKVIKKDSTVLGFEGYSWYVTNEAGATISTGYTSKAAAQRQAGSMTTENPAWTAAGRELDRLLESKPGAPKSLTTTAQAATPKKRSVPAAKAAAAREAKRADYFTPGNVVKGYGGLDRVISYSPPDESGQWGVKVQRVVKRGDSYVVAKEGGRDAEVRQHATEPGERDLKAGPVERAVATIGKVEADAPVGSEAEAKSPAEVSPSPAAEQTDRFEAGRALTKEQRKQVLGTLVDVYKSKGAPREMKGQGRDGNERHGYVHSPDLFEKSDITGAMVRYYVTMPDGRKAHPTELFPDYTQSDIDAEMAAREAHARNIGADVKRATVPAQQFSTVREAVEWWDKRSRESVRTAQGQPTIYPSDERRPLTDGRKFILVPNSTSSEMLGAFAEAGWIVAPGEVLTEAKPSEAAPEEPQASQEETNDRNHFSLERLNHETNQMEAITFERGEHVRVALTGAGKDTFGEIDGVSHARREFSVDGLWHPFGAAYKAERPATPVRPTVPMSKVVDAVNAKNSAGIGPADAVSVLEAFKGTMREVYDGKASVEDYRAGYKRVRDEVAVKAELNKMTKDDLIRTFGIMARPSEAKASLVETAYKAMLRSFALGKEYGPNSYIMSSGGLAAHESKKREALDSLVEGQTEEDLAAYAAEVAKRRAENTTARAARVEAIQNPKTLDDFRSFMSYHTREGKTTTEVRRALLTPEQRAEFDRLLSAESRGRRKVATEQDRTAVRLAGQKVDGQIIATKHTKKGHDLYVVQLSERVSREDYETLNAGAKRIGGYYSSYRGGGATPGFQFDDRAKAEAFVSLANGDNTAAKEAAKERRDAFEDDRSQSASERLTEMADRLDERADESLGRERKANTARRARFAASAEAGARADKALAQTMRNLVNAIASGSAPMLDRVRQKVQVEYLRGAVATANDAMLRERTGSYAEFEKVRGTPPTQEAADFATFPEYTAMRSDLAALGRQLLDTDGTKALGQRMMRVADDVSDAFKAWVKEDGNLSRLSVFSEKGTGKLATFRTSDAAERAIARSGYKGKAIPWQVKRGEWIVTMSPSEAITRGIWKGDGDKRITLSDEFGAELVEKVGKANRRGARVSLPWVFESTYDRRKLLGRMGIETAAEFRMALREFIGLQEQPEAPSRVKELERALIGRRNDGFDFFPTPESTADEMVSAADIQPGMRVLEPSAGMGHIADRIRAAGNDPDVIEIEGDKRDLLEAKGFNLVGRDFLDFNDADHAERGATFGDLMRAPDGTEGILRGQGGMGSDRVRLVSDEAEPRELGKFNFSDLELVERRGVGSGYDRILMNPPFSNGRDIEHVRHAYELLKPGGRLVAIMGESAFSNQNKRATEFRDWLDELGGTSEKLAEGTFLDPNLPVNTGANARMVVVDKGQPSSPGGKAPVDETHADESGSKSMFSRIAGGASTNDETNALRALAENDELLALPRSDAKTVASIASDIDPRIKVTRVAAQSGQTQRYRIDMPDRRIAYLMVRAPNPYGPTIYAYDLVDGEMANTFEGRPGENAKAIPDDVEDVFIDVSKLKEGGDGGKVYAIAAAFAHNTDRVFIGDPAGLSDEAMRRRPEQMLSSALRVGTTEHLAPHPRQIEGDAKIGVPPLRWVYGDHLGNIRRLVDLNLKAIENAGYDDAGLRFDPDTGNFLGPGGGVIDRADIGDSVDGLPSREHVADRGYGVRGAQGDAGVRPLPRALAGGRTIARAAVLRALLREEGRESETGGQRDGLLARITKLAGDAPQAVASLFSRSSAAAASGQGSQARVDEVNRLVGEITSRWANAPTVKVLESSTDPQVPSDAWDLGSASQSRGDTKDIGGLYYKKTGVVYLFADKLPGDVQVVNVLFHEALGHAGLRGTFGKELGTILDRLAILNQGKVRAKAKQYHLDYDKPSDRREAAEEVLAEMAERTPELGWVKRAIAAIRTFLREHIPGFSRMRMTDAEIVRNFIMPARRHVMQGGSSVASDVAMDEGGAALFSRSPSEVLRSINQESIRNAFLDATTGHDNVSLWAKTVGTQYDKAQRHPQTFGRVFNAVQDYIKDISSFANAAADQAPSILPKLDNFRDLVRKGTPRADLDAVGKVIFQGTLDKQLLDRPALLAKGLTEKQADLYEEFRAAVNQSLEDMAKTEIVRLAGTAGAPLASQALAAPTAREAADILAERLRQQGLAEDADGLYGKVDTVEKLKAEGYAPLMRFGKHTVHIQRGGETLFFGMYESRTEANAMARKLRGDAEFAGLPVEQGVMSQEAYKLFNGLSIDSLELFANEVGGQDNPVYQDFLKLTKNNRSALKRLIHRNGTAGFSTNTERILASFVTSNARLASGNLHLGRAKAAANDIPKELGDLKDEAVRLVDYVQNPQEEAQAVRGLLFTTFIGGSVASALVNMTQPFVMTLPHLSQYGGLAKAGARMLAALKTVAGGKATGEIAQALRRAEADGIVSPQEIHHLQAATTDSLGNNPYLKKAAFIWGSMFSLAEQFNRRLSFVAAYQTALDNNIANPFAFAEKAVIETQGLYNKGNKANWARGPIGATAMTFKQFSTSYIEWITRMYQSGPEGKKAAITALAILMLAGGAGGLPFADDVDDLIDTLAQALGYDFNSKRAKRKFISDTLGLGDTAAEVATRGLTALPGFPMDLSVRLGMGNLLPATGILLRSNTDRSRDLLEVAGAGGGLAKMALDAGEKALQGDPLGAAKAVVPVAIQNVAKALEMWNTGEYRNQKGAKVMDVDAVDGAMKFVGFQPAEVARESAEVNAIQRTIQLVKNVESDLAGRMAQARVDGDIEAEQEARQELIDWNRKNPDSPIRIRPADIARRARELRASRADRLVKSAPKELRPAVQGALN